MSPKKFETNAIRQQLSRTPYGEHSSPLFLTSSFVFEDAEHMRASFAEENDQNLYSRFSNPNTTEFIDKVVTMEGAEAGFAFASGMAAVFSTFAALLNSGDHIVSCQSVFGSTHALFTKFFPKWNIETSYFKVDQLETLESLIQPNTKVIYAESPTNPAVDILDLEALGNIAKKHNLILIGRLSLSRDRQCNGTSWGCHAPSKYFEPTKGGHYYATDLVQQIHKLNQGTYLHEVVEVDNKSDFCIGVAGYPEKHIESPSLHSDLLRLKEKVDAGADYVVTQMFFDNQRYFKFVTMAREIGITIPIIPGIKPLAIQKHLQLLPQVFKIDLPEALIKEVNGCSSNAQIRQVGVEWAIQQSKELLDFGVPVLHYYSM